MLAIFTPNPSRDFITLYDSSEHYGTIMHVYAILGWGYIGSVHSKKALAFLKKEWLDHLKIVDGVTIMQVFLLHFIIYCFTYHKLLWYLHIL